MAEYDGLPLNTPTKVTEDAELEVWATRTANGGTVERRAKAGSKAANLVAIDGKLQDLIDDYAIAQAILQAQRDTAQITLSGTTVTQVRDNSQVILRALQVAIKEQAMLQQEHMQRTVTIAKKLLNKLDDLDGT